jgi:hypothetical protein
MRVWDNFFRRISLLRAAVPITHIKHARKQHVALVQFEQAMEHVDPQSRCDFSSAEC